MLSPLLPIDIYARSGPANNCVYVAMEAHEHGTYWQNCIYCNRNKYNTGHNRSRILKDINRETQVANLDKAPGTNYNSGHNRSRMLMDRNRGV